MGGRVERQPLAGNIIQPTRISPIAKKYLDFYPLPNQAGDRVGRNNFLSPNVRGDDFHSESYRFDHQLTDKQRMFFRYTHNSRREFRGNWSGVTNGIRATGNYLFRINNGGTFDHVYTLSPTTVFNYRVGYQRFAEPNVRQHEGAVDPAILGFSSQTTALFGGIKYLPRFEIGQFSSLGEDLGGAGFHNIYSCQPTLTKILNGGHQLRIGYDFRAYRENGRGLGHAAGRYDFGNTYTKGPLDNSAAAPIGQELAAFLLGQPTGGFIDRNAQRSNQTLFNGVFFQDDWKITSRVTLNLGLRYEYEGAITERYNRNVFTFDRTVSNPIEAAAKAAYALSPIAEIAPADFKVRGGYLFLGENRRSVWDADKNNFQPRLGLAYRIGDKTVLRGGWAVYTVPFVIDGLNQAGFSQATLIVPSNDTGVTFVANLANPFPKGVPEPPGSSLGLSTSLGRDLNFVPTDRRNGQSQRWEAGVQRELPGRWVVEAAYVGNRAYDLSVDTDIYNAVPRQYLSTRPERDQATIDFLTFNVTNPFRGLFDPTTGLGSNMMVQRQQLLRPYPEFGGTIRGRRNDASSNFHSAQFRGEKRFSMGYTLLASYTYSHWIRRTDFLNATDTQFDERFDNNDVKNRVVVSGIWELPFGKGRRWGSGWQGFVDGFLGGWQAQGIFQAQGGRPLTFDDNYLFRGDLNTVALQASQRTVDRWFNIDGFEKTTARQLSNNLRTAPRLIPGVRGQGLNLWDLSVIKNISITEQVKFQLRGEFLNAFNHPQFSDPNRSVTNTNFGKITGQSNLPRNVQIGLKLIF